MTANAGQQRLWERFESWAWDGIFLVCLALPTAIAVRDEADAGVRAVTVALALAFAAWHWAWVMRDRSLAERAPMALWFAGVLVFTPLLLGRHGSFFIVIWGLYPQLFGLLGRYAIPAVVALTGAVAWRLGAFSAGLQSEMAISVVVSTVLAVLIGYSLRALGQQSEQRRAALEALEATRAELAAASHRAGALEERARLSREVHDTVAQSFTGILMQLEACEQALDAQDPSARAHLVRARDSARDSLSEVRRAVHALRPEPLDGVGLVEAIDRTVRRFADASGIRASFATVGAPSTLPPDLEVALLRAVQEGLANVARHAGPAAVQVTLDADARGIRLDISDDGSGFDAASASADGLGLRGMRERLTALGGSLEVESAPGAGTHLRVAVPGP